MATTDDKLDRIFESLDGLRQSMADLRVTVQGIAERGVARGQRIDDLEATVYGNGHPGLKEDVRGIKQHCADATCSPIRKLILGIIEKVAANCVVVFLAWLLWMYAMHMHATAAAMPKP